MFERGRLKAGESILIHGGSSGIGTTAIQLARALGARVFATAGSAEKCAACERLGAERAINYREADFVAAVREATGGRGVDVVLDMVGGDYLAAQHGRPRDGRPARADRGPQRREGHAQPDRDDAAPADADGLDAARAAGRGEGRHRRAQLRTHVWPLLESGAVRPVIHATFPLRAAADAHRVLESGAHIGKLVLVTT